MENNSNSDILFVKIFKKINALVNDDTVAPFDGLSDEEKFTFLAKSFFILGMDMANVLDALKEIQDSIKKVQ